MSKYGVFSGPYFPVFGLQKTPYLDTFHPVSSSKRIKTKYWISEEIRVILLNSYKGGLLQYVAMKKIMAHVLHFLGFVKLFDRIIF